MLESDFNVRSKGNPDESHPDTVQIRDACMLMPGIKKDTLVSLTTTPNGLLGSTL